MPKLRPYISIIALCICGMGVSSVDAADIERIVVGAHPTFTRVVFHMSDATPFAQTLDEAGQHTLVLDNVTRAGPTQSFATNHTPVTGLAYREDNNSLRITFTTSAAVTAKSFALTPDNYGGHRVVIDFPKQSATPASVKPIPRVKDEPETQPAAIPVPEPKSLATASIPSSEPIEDPCRQTQIILNQNQWNMAALIEHGLCKKEAGRLEEAQSILERILTFDPEFHRARLALADVYAGQGLPSKAREAYTYVLKTNPPSDVRSEIELRLSQLN